MAKMTTRCPASAVRAVLLLVTLLACAPALEADDDEDDRVAGEHAAVKVSSVCDGVDCGRGSCELRSGWIPGTISYKCECDPGWRRAIRSIPFSPCNVPMCSFNSSCFDLSMMLPRGIPFSDPCVAVNCGAGTCKKDEGFHYHCECDPGNVNMLNDTKFPCVDANCMMGLHCPALDHPAPPPSPPSSSRSPPADLRYAGAVLFQSLLQKLLVASLVIAQVM